MKVKISWLIGILTLCLLSALFAAILTPYILTRSVLGQELLWALSGHAETLATSTSETVAPAAGSPTPAPEPSVTPSPAVTPAPTPTPRPADSSQPAGDQLELLANVHRIETIYQAITPSIVGINVEFSGSGSATPLTNRGTGLIIDERGLIVTNASVLTIALTSSGRLANEASLSVFVPGADQPFTAELVGRDQMTGLAVLSIDPDDQPLKAAPLSASPDLKVGQIVLACGYPDNLSAAGIMTSGIICGLNRWVRLEDGTSLQMIQTDTHLAQGSSGGPLLNLDGAVIGLSNSTLLRDNYDSLGYALPVAAIRQVVSNLISQSSDDGKCWLGLAVLRADGFRELQKLYRFPDGLYISSVIKDSPAYVASLRKGDIITRINEQKVNIDATLTTVLEGKKAGDTIKIEVYRRSDGLYHEYKVYLQEYKR